MLKQFTILNAISHIFVVVVKERLGLCGKLWLIKPLKLIAHVIPIELL